jgi:hypothetical protein
MIIDVRKLLSPCGNRTSIDFRAAAGSDSFALGKELSVIVMISIRLQWARGARCGEGFRYAGMRKRRQGW